MLPADHGDCLLIEYGEAATPNRILIDGGTQRTFEPLRQRLAKIGNPAPLDLVVVTHVDTDHIGGALALMAEDPPLIAPADVWFNAYHHLTPDRLGPRHGEALSTAIEDAGFPWNVAFDGASVVVPDDGLLPRVALPGDASIVLLSPRWQELDRMKSRWEEELKKAGLVPGAGLHPDDVLGKRPPPGAIDMDALLRKRFQGDRAPANGSSIAFLFEHDDKRVLFGADAHVGPLETALTRLGVNRDAPLELDAFKVAHHGSMANVSAELLARLRCKRFLLSTSGDVFGHPNPEAIARIVSGAGAKTLVFNYDSDYTRPWARVSLREAHDYEALYPDEGQEGYVVQL
jgi:glyoxylase-like metal-dependent hydrolase (beta-lactamase superfamily II)